MDKYGEILKLANTFCFLAEAEKVYGPYRQENGREFVVIKNDDGTTRTTALAKYLMEKHLNRKLDPDLETVNHINRDKNDNDINNLEILPRKEHSALDTRRVKLVKFKCSLCDKDFERSPRLVRDKSKKGATGIFCSRQCAGRYSRQVQLGLIDKLPVQPYIESEYYRNSKEAEASYYYLINKYS